MLASLTLYAPKILFDFFIDVFYFIPWWYSRGLQIVTRGLWQKWRAWEAELALGGWLRHFFKPVTARTSGTAGIGDIAWRIFGIGWRILLLALWSGGAIGLLLVYVLMPPLVVWQIVYQIVTL